MNFTTLFSNWKEFSAIWTLVQPFVLNLLRKNVPNAKIKPYEKLVKWTQKFFDNAYKLKEKKETQNNSVYDYCYEQLVGFIDAYLEYLSAEVKKLHS